MNGLRIVTLRCVVLALAFGASQAFATHVPGSNDVVSYDGTLTSGVPVTGTIGWGTPVGGYDWYCFSAPNTSAITFAATRTSGDIRLNVQFYAGTVANGSPVSAFPGGVLSGTANSSSPDVSYSFTPPAAGTYTVAVSTWSGELQGSYSLTMTGGAPASCGAPVAPTASLPVPALTPASLALMSLVLALAGFLGLRSRRRG